ncbi:Acriflavine resistance protein A precursor [Raoultella planticola]|uniref:Acriflavine resistance protein A n=1 Tax=Raoultella planticola TaxID=575 RepID=A0A485DBV7_RAOPL|nr:Acriflavine resistance protein A precursor [Raoultella planticola]
MNKNRGLTPLAVVLMLSGSLALTGCDDKPAQQGAQHMPEVGIVTLKSAPLQITTELPGRTSALPCCRSPSSGKWHYSET